jgi:Tol biopolymer transport system component
MFNRTTIILCLGLALAACAGQAYPNNIVPDALVPEASPTPELAANNPLAGLTFRAGSTLWQVDQAGKAQQLSICARGTALSPDQSMMLFSENDHISLVDLGSCEVTSLTGFSENLEINPQFWPGRPDVGIFGVNPEFHAGLPGIINLDGGGYAVLDTEASPNDLPALSPDGRTLAYNAYGHAILYDVDARSRTELDVSQFGLDPSLIARLDSPAWSPDGGQLAWNAGIYTDPSQTIFQIELIILDLNSNSHTIIHPYEPVGRGGWPPAPVWSPNGQWLILNMWISQPENSFGYWLVKADGSEAHLLRPENAGFTPEQASPPVWRPDSQAVAFSYASLEPSHFFVTLGDRALTPLPLPADAYLLDWAALP